MDLKTKNNNDLNEKKTWASIKQTDDKNVAAFPHFELLHYIAAAFHLLSNFLDSICESFLLLSVVPPFSWLPSSLQFSGTT